MKSSHLIHIILLSSLIKVLSVYNPFFRFSAFHSIVNTTIASANSINLTSRTRSNDFLAWLATTKPKTESVAIVSDNETSTDDSDDTTVTSSSSSSSQQHHINDDELQLALDQALKMIEASDDDIKTLGWKLVQKTDHFSLYKRRSRPKNEGPYEYMMTGEFSDVSPKCWLQCQVDKSLRGSWDDTMKSMSVLYEQANQTSAVAAGHVGVVSAGIDKEDIIYYRTKWLVHTEFKN